MEKKKSNNRTMFNNHIDEYLNKKPVKYFGQHQGDILSKLCLIVMPIREKEIHLIVFVSVHSRGFQQYLCTFPEESDELIAYHVTKSKAKPSR